MTREPQRRLELRVSGTRKPEATDNPEALAQAITAWLLGRTDQQPTIYLPRGTQ